MTDNTKRTEPPSAVGDDVALRAVAELISKVCKHPLTDNDPFQYVPAGLVVALRTALASALAARGETLAAVPSMRDLGGGRQEFLPPVEVFGPDGPDGEPPPLKQYWRSHEKGVIKVYVGMPRETLAAVPCKCCTYFVRPGELCTKCGTVQEKPVAPPPADALPEADEIERLRGVVRDREASMRELNKLLEQWQDRAEWLAQARGVEDLERRVARLEAKHGS